MKYTINIGLRDNNYSKAVELINNARQGGYFEDYHIREMNGEYNGVPEPTIVLTLETKADVVSMTELVKRWCTQMNQICIAIQLRDKENNTFGALIYEQNWKGEQASFNSKYFLTNN